MDYYKLVIITTPKVVIQQSLLCLSNGINQRSINWLLIVVDTSQQHSTITTSHILFILTKLIISFCVVFVSIIDLFHMCNRLVVVTQQEVVGYTRAYFVQATFLSLVRSKACEYPEVEKLHGPEVTLLLNLVMLKWQPQQRNLWMDTSCLNKN